MVSFLWCIEPSHSISDFVWFSFRPEHLSKSDNKSNNFDAGWTSERSTVVSSAYCESLTSLCLSIVISFISFERLIICASNSIAITNSVPESGQPWRTQRSRWNFFEAYPLFKTFSSRTRGASRYELLLLRVIVRVHTVSYDIGSVFLELLFSSDKPVDVEFWVAPLYTWKRFFHCDTLWGRGHGYFKDIKVALYQRNLFTGIICVKKIERNCFISDLGGLENFMYLREISFLLRQILCTIFL